MTTKEKNIYKKVLSSCIVLSMVLTGFATMFIIGGPVDTVKAGGTNEDPSIRIYGDYESVYPTHSYMDNLDFFYKDETQPFDPGVIEKDSITFNAVLHKLLLTSGYDGIDYDEKVFLRTFYEPGFSHGQDDKVPGPDGGACEEFDAVVTETTYMLIKDDRTPYAATTPVVMELPYKGDQTTAKPGMENIGEVSVRNAQYNDESLVGGNVDVSITMQIPLNQEVKFFDHKIKFTGRQLDVLDGTEIWTYIADVGYLGNYNEYHHSTITHPGPYADIGLPEHFTCYFNRANDKIYAGPFSQPIDDPAYRWFVKVINWNEDNQDITVKIGRRLFAGETFYVDGVRYDMPAICVNAYNQFKYLTLQSPLPKAPGDDVFDNSHVDSQWLQRLDHCPEHVWMLPPYSENHLMIDDIGLHKDYIDPCAVDGLILDGPLTNNMVGPLEFCWSEETIEPRFNTSLVERLESDMYGVTEWWEWYGVHTLPDHYTAFILPDQEKSDSQTQMQYIDECTSYPFYADGFEYLITSSFIAPNSKTGEVSNWLVHEILDKVQDIAKQEDDTRVLYYMEPRVAFEYDAFDGTDLYINDEVNDVSDASVRTYGENNAVYPTHSYYNDVDFMYDDETEPFDPGVIAKDSITFNPALLNTLLTSQEGIDYDEKIFLRLFYEPGYSQITDIKMPGPYGGSCEEFDAVVTETTYMTVDEERQPYAIPAGPYWKLKGPDRDPTTAVIELPYKADLTTDKPGLEIMDEVSVRNAEYNGPLTHGAVDVSMTLSNIDFGQPIYFMDHVITFTGRHKDLVGGTEIWHYTADIGYTGNYNEEYDSTQSYPGSYSDKGLPEKYTCYFNRANHKIQAPPQASPPYAEPIDEPAYRWFVKVLQWNEDTHDIMVKVGRRLFAGETFYVDGVRYDMPGIYVNDQYEFKYLTLQSPLPKAPGDDVFDNSHVDSQWLQRLDHCPEHVWMLPPYSQRHIMIDDIGLEKINAHGFPFVDCSVKGIQLKGDPGDNMVGPLNFCWVEETIEPRFNTSLVERLFSNNLGDSEWWSWFGVHTLPDRFTSFVLPDQEECGDEYFEPCVDSSVTADGFEYLITSSWLAPNSNLVEPNNWYKHDIRDHVHDIELYGERIKFADEPRVAFEHDGTNDTGLYINTEGTCHPPVAIDDSASVECGGNTVDIPVLINDNDPDPGDVITLYDIVTPSADIEGTAYIVGNQIRYISPDCDSGKTYPYKVSFVYKIRDSQGYFDTAIVNVTISNGGSGGDNPPTACFDWTPTHPDTCEPVTFNACTSFDDDDGDGIDDGSIVSYSWDWNNDGVFDEIFNHPTCTVTHQWCTPGTYTVGLKVVDNEGDYGIITHDITVGCLVNLYFDKTMITLPKSGSSQECSLMMNQGTQDVGLLDVTITWDSTLVDVDTASVTFNPDFDEVKNKNIDNTLGQMSFSAFNYSTLPTIDWIVNFTFDGKTVGTGQLEVTPNQIGANNPGVVDITSQTCATPSTIEVTNGGGCTPGDIVDFGVIDQLDLLALGNIIYGADPYPTPGTTEFCRCDVHDDNAIDGLDYLKLGTMVYNP